MDINCYWRHCSFDEASTTFDFNLAYKSNVNWPADAFRSYIFMLIVSLLFVLVSTVVLLPTVHGMIEVIVASTSGKSRYSFGRELRNRDE